MKPKEEIIREEIIREILTKQWHDPAIRIEMVHKDVAFEAMEEYARSIKVCKGCGHLSIDKIEPPYLGCCPDNNYVTMKEFAIISKHFKSK